MIAAQRVQGYGHLVVVDVGAVFEGGAAVDALHPDERALTTKFGEKRLRTFCAGRQALRAALNEAGVVVDGAILRDDRGAPVLPKHIKASITHKDDVAAALVDVDGAGCVGVDLEFDDGRDRVSVDKLARQVLTPREIALLPDDDAARRRALFVAFSLKEALYKALDPYVRRYVGFLEVEFIDGALHIDRVDGVGSFAAAGSVVDVGRPGIIVTVARVVRG